jgi:hypothetical protein
MTAYIRSALCGAVLFSFASIAEATSKGYTLIVAPARYSVIQVAFDIVQRNPAVLVSYQAQGKAAEPLLHAWNGREWIHISMQDFREVSFLEQMPTRTVLVGDDATLPATLRDAASWSPEIIRVNALTTSALVNEMGRAFDWSESEWKWMARRFNLNLHDESEPLRKSSWYDQPGPLYRPPIRDAIRFEGNAEPESAPAPILNSGNEAPPADEPTSYVPPPAAAPEPPPAPVQEVAPSTWSAPKPITGETPSSD